MKKLLLIGIGIVGMSFACVQAEENKPVAPACPVAPKVAKPIKAKPELKELTVVGMLEKTEAKKKNGAVVTGVKLVTENGVAYNLRVPAKKNSPGGNLMDLVGSKVKIVGKGSEGKHNMIAVITSVEKVEPVAAPAAK